MSPRAVSTALAATVLVLLASIVAACAGPPEPRADDRVPERSPAVLLSAAAPSMHSPPTQATGNSAVEVARLWLAAYRSASWSDAVASSWIDRVRPYITAAMHEDNERLRHGGGGADWADFVRRRCTSRFSAVDAVVPTESPGTDTAINVLLTGTLRTRCADDPHAMPDEHASATVVVIRLPHGAWRVDQRIF